MGPESAGSLSEEGQPPSRIPRRARRLAMTGAWKIEIAQVRLTRIPQTAQAGPLEPFLRVVMGVTVRGADCGELSPAMPAKCKERTALLRQSPPHRRSVRSECPLNFPTALNTSHRG